MADPRINEENVHRAILDDQTHTIWTPCLALERMGIERYPHQPKHNRMAMRRVLKALSERGALVERMRKHSHSVFDEVAYELGPKEEPKR